MARLAPAFLLLAGCGLFGPDEAPAPPFGTVTTFVGGRTWMSSPEPDSVVVSFNPASGWFRLSGFTQDPNGDLKSVSLRSCRIMLADLAGGAAADIVHYLQGLQPPGIVGDWWEFWGSQGLLHVVSMGVTGDHLAVEALDLAARTIRGSFRFHGESFSGFDRRVIEGRFNGRVRILDEDCSISTGG